MDEWKEGAFLLFPVCTLLLLTLLLSFLFPSPATSSKRTAACLLLESVVLLAEVGDSDDDDDFSGLENCQLSGFETVAVGGGLLGTPLPLKRPPLGPPRYPPLPGPPNVLPVV